MSVHRDLDWRAVLSRDARSKCMLICAVSLIAAVSWARSPDGVTGVTPHTSLWVDPSRQARAVATPEEITREETAVPRAPVTLGSNSGDLTKVAKGVLAKRFPSAAFALLSFNPAPNEQGERREVLAGVPTEHSVDLVAAGAPRSVIDESMVPFWPLPYQQASDWYVGVSITTENVGGDRRLSTISAQIVYSTGEPIAPPRDIDPPVRFLWSQPDRQLLEIYTSIE